MANLKASLNALKRGGEYATHSEARTVALTTAQANAFAQHVALKARMAPSAARRAEWADLADRIPSDGGAITVTERDVATHAPTRRLYDAAGRA